MNKFGTQILTLITRIFGLAADSTEQEIHQHLSTVKSMDEMRSEIRTEFNTQLGELDALRAGDVELRQQIDKLNARITELEAQVSERDTTITNLQTELGKKPAVAHTGGSTEGNAGNQVSAGNEGPRKLSSRTQAAREKLGYA